jgi:peroxiredoxin/predicted 2-oxoglutarate/Fe(II)-dependent dioxygenase YbiX
MTASPPVRPPEFGEPAPLFVAATDGVERYGFDVAGGRWIVLMVFATLSLPACAEAHAAVLARRDLFNDEDACFFGVSADRADRLERGLANQPPGLRYFWDYEHAISRLYGLNDGVHLRPAVFLIDPMLRIVMAEPIEATTAVLDRLAAELAAAEAIPPEAQPFAPILIAPRIFEPELCAALIAYYGRKGGTQSGFAATQDGRTVTQLNAALKRRRDVMIEDEDLRLGVETRLRQRLFPLIQRAWGWRATEIERYLVCCYDAQDQGFFSRHRDDATAGTAHRRFAVSLNLNTEAYEGGELRFPEFGPRLYSPPTGGAAVFGCSLLHEAMPVTRGLRYTFVPFLYDAAGLALRNANLNLVGPQASAGPNAEPPTKTALEAIAR